MTTQIQSYLKHWDNFTCWGNMLFKILHVFSLCWQDIRGMNTPEELENFMLKHGNEIIDTLGGEVDRIEKNLKASVIVSTKNLCRLP